VITFIAQKQGGVIPTLDRIPLDYRVANIFLSYIRYIGKLIWPSGLAACYPYPHISSSDFRTVICMGLLTLLSIFSIYICRRKKYVMVGWLWFVGTLVPVIGLVQSGAQAMANRYMYIPMLGLLIIVGWTVKDYTDKQPRIRIIAIILGAALLSSLLILTRMQVRHWQNSTTLFEYALNVTGNNPVAENSYGCALFDENRLEDAVLHLRKAVRLDPVFATAVTNLAKVYIKQGKYNESAVCLDDIIRRNEGTADTYYNLAIAMSLQKKYDEAIKYFTKTLKIDSQYPDVHYRMGAVLLEAGKTSEAITHLNEALQTGKNKADIYINLGTAYTQLGKYNLALENWTKAAELKTDNAELLNNMAWLLGTVDDTSVKNAAKAIELAQRACKLTGYNEAVYLDTLSAAYAGAGRFDEAKTAAEKAILIAKSKEQKDLAEEIQKRLKLYEAKQPYRQK
jgi:protein O-mannosyl-transferase